MALIRSSADVSLSPSTLPISCSTAVIRSARWEAGDMSPGPKTLNVSVKVESSPNESVDVIV